MSALAAALAEEGYQHNLPQTMTGSEFAFHCCAQFVATRAAVLKHPRRFYEIVLAYLMDPNYFVSGPAQALPPNGKAHAHFIEPLWQVVFGEALNMDSDAPCQHAVQPWRSSCAAKSCARQPL